MRQYGDRFAGDRVDAADGNDVGAVNPDEFLRVEQVFKIFEVVEHQQGEEEPARCNLV